jgi:hypothetical protein
MIGIYSVLFLAILIGIVYLVSTLINKVVNKKGKYSYSKRVIKIFCVYLAIMLICLALDLINPGKGLSDWKTVSTKNLDKENSVVYNAASKGEIDKIDPAFLVEKWKFTYHERQLPISSEDEALSNSNIFVERKNTNDGEIDALYYHTRLSMNQLDLTKYFKPLQLELTDGQLRIMKPQQRELKFSELANVFSVNQFTGVNSFSHHSEFHDGVSILYLRIPKELQLTDESGQPVQPKVGLNIEYVN